MEAILNQSTEDARVNGLILRRQSDVGMIEDTKQWMDKFYQRYLEGQTKLSEAHILKHGRPILVLEDSTIYFSNTVGIHNELQLLQQKVSAYEKGIKELDIELDGRTWRYL